MTREQWLKQCGRKIMTLLKAKGFITTGDWRVSVGFPKTRGGRNSAIGQCWSKIVSSDKTTEIFISPLLDEASRVADVLAHELVHHVVGVKEGHNKVFYDCAKAIGLTGPATATVASPEFEAWFIKANLPKYPHAKMRHPEVDGLNPAHPQPRIGGAFPGWVTPKAGTSGVMVKFECGGCGAKWKMNKRDALLVTVCPCCAAETK